MKASDIPTKFQVAFAADASGANVRPIPLTTIDPTAASQQLGFPPETFTPLTAGGVAPDGRDMNGVLNMATAWNRWMSAGAPVPYDGGFSTAIGGYPAGTVLSAATLGQFWISTADDNTSNPDTGGGNWSLSTSTNFYALDTGTTNTYVGAYIPNFSTPVAGLPLRLKIANTNTGASTFNGKAVVRRDLSALIGGELVVGQIATFAYLGTATDKYQLQGIAPASNATTITGTDTQSAVTPASLQAALPKTFQVQEQRASGVASSNAPSSGGWVTVVLTTTLVNQIPGASIAGNVLTLPSGTYDTMASYTNGQQGRGGKSQLRLQDTATPATLALGLNMNTANQDGANNNTWGAGLTPCSGHFVLTASVTVELQVRVNSNMTAATGNAWGTEVYVDLIIKRVGP